ncbi:MAG: DUF3943 domain-containing protein [Comamonadaceae bacterium]|nr:DUF3943 domain-containing protein [Comamonadaceae bacterium]
MWEVMMEKYRPSINDLITTSTGGIAIGEVGYRFSALVRKTGARGARPRLARGRRDHPRSRRRRQPAPQRPRGRASPWLPGSPDRRAASSTAELVLTGPVIARSAGLSGTRTAPILGFTLRLRRPGRRGLDGTALRRLLRRRPPPLGTGQAPPVAGHQRRAGRQAPGGPPRRLVPFRRALPALRVLRHRHDARLRHLVHGRLDLDLPPGPPNTRLTASARLGWLGLGGTDDFCGVPGERRNYNLATGVTAAAELSLDAKGYEYLSAGWRHYHPLQPARRRHRPGREHWDIVQAQVSVPVLKRTGVGLAAEYCGRNYVFEVDEPGSRHLPKPGPSRPGSSNAKEAAHGQHKERLAHQRPRDARGGFGDPGLPGGPRRPRAPRSRPPATVSRPGGRSEPWPSSGWPPSARRDSASARAGAPACSSAPAGTPRSRSSSSASPRRRRRGRDR